jgi:signal transduction histidine kinase
MTTIAGFIDGILDGTIPPEKQNYYLHIVSEEIKRLSRLVRSMLDLSRIDSGELKLNYQKFDLLDMLVTIIITFEREIENKNIEIKGLDEISPKIVYGDKDLIYQVVYNLIENAVKFTNEGGYIEFRIDESLEQFDFIIKNSGMGIKKSEIDLVFGRFYKTDKSRSKDKKGLGLGLYLVRSIIRLHGGDITANSVYGEYTEFDFYLPKKNSNKKSDRKSLPG